MTINELIQLHTSGLLRSVTFHRTFNHRQMKENKVFITFVSEHESGQRQEVTFMLQDYALNSAHLTHELLKKHGISYSFSDLTAPLGQQTNNTTPDKRNSGPSQGVGVLPKEPTLKTCGVCSKSDFDDCRGCYNPSMFSPAVGDWVCNLMRVTA